MQYKYQISYASPFKAVYNNIESMDEQQRGSTNPSMEERLARMHQLVIQLQAHPQSSDNLLREYTTIYIESHHLSEEYFTALCEHRFLHMLVDNSERIQESTCILECINLLMTNTKAEQELVYVLSQNVLHEYLFSSSILKRDGEFVEYYVQLLKTILMKISEHEQNKSLLRMFCNNKYPNFPLLTYSTILACDANELIKVTAQQCILIIVGMINEKKLYEMYLSEPPLMIFIVRLATEFLKVDSDHEGICKYLADLMYELRNNRKSLFLVSNIVCNVIIVATLPKKITVSLSFIESFTRAIEIRVLEHKGLRKQQNNEAYYSSKKEPKTTKISRSSSQMKLASILQQNSCDNLVIICSVFYRVLVKYLTNKYINAVYLSAFVHLCPALSNINQKQPEDDTSLPLKIMYPGPQAEWKILQDYSFKKYFEDDDHHSNSEVELGSDFLDDAQSKMNEYMSSKQFIKLKEGYLKKTVSTAAKAQSFFGRIFNRGTSDQLNNQYMKYVSDFCSISFVKGEPVSLNFSKQLNPSTCPFLSEYMLLTRQLKKGMKYDSIKTGQESDSVEPNQIHFNDLRGMWRFTPSSLDIIAAMTRRFVEFINSQSSESPALIVPKLYIPPSYLLLGQLKDYLSSSIHNHLNSREPKNAELLQSIPMLITLSRVCTMLNVQINENVYVALIVELSMLFQQIQACLFENGFHDVIEYVRNKNKLIYQEIQEKNKSKTKLIASSTSRVWESNVPKNKAQIQQKKTSIKLKAKPSRTFLKICSFQCIQKIMDPHIRPLNKHFEVKWRQSFSKKPQFFEDFHEQTLGSFKVSYFGKSGCILNLLKLATPPSIVLRIELNNKKLLQIDITDLEPIKKNSIDPRVIQFGGSVENIKTESVEQGDAIIQKFKECMFAFQQCITNATLEYLTSSNETLNIKGNNMMKRASWRTSTSSSSSFDTPY